MSPRRRPRESRWERSASGIYLPRRNWPPVSTRFIQPMGAAQNCCETDDRCVVCEETHATLEFDITLAGWSAGECVYFNDTFRVTYNSTPPTGTPFSAYTDAWWYAFIDEENTVYDKQPEIWFSIQCAGEGPYFPRVSITPCLRGESLETQVHFWDDLEGLGAVPVDCSAIDVNIVQTDYYSWADCDILYGTARIQGVA